MRALHAALGVVALVVAATGATAVPAPGAVPPESTTAARGPSGAIAGEAPAATAPTSATAEPMPGSFGRDRYVEHRGDVVAITVEAPANGTARVSLRGPGVNATVAVTDGAGEGAGDGQVRLRLNTYAGTWSVGDAGDAVEVVEGAVPRMPPAGSYRLTLAGNDENATRNGDEATLRLRPRSLHRLGVWQSPAGETNLTSAADVRAAAEEGRLRRATGVNGSHLLVVRVDATGLEGALAAADGPNATARFRSVLREHGDFLVVQTNPSVERDPRIVHVLDGPGVRALADAANDTYYLAIDLGEARVTSGDADPAAALEDDPFEPYRFEVRMELAADSPLTEGGERAVATVEPRGARVSTAPDGIIHFRPAPNRTVVGTTNVGTGWNVTVVLAGEDDPNTTADESFRLARPVAVEFASENRFDHAGRFAASFDLSDAAAAVNVTADVRFGGRSLLDEPVPVAVTRPRASVTTRGANTSGEFAAVTVSVALSTGGFVVLHAGGRGGPVVGHTGFLDPGEHVVEVYVGAPTDAEEVVAVAHRDVNHNEWFDGPGVDTAYAGDDPAAVAFGPTPTATPSPASGETAGTATDGTDRTPTGTTTPGFGVVAGAVALLAVLAALGRE